MKVFIKGILAVILLYSLLTILLFLDPASLLSPSQIIIKDFLSQLPKSSDSLPRKRPANPSVPQSQCKTHPTQYSSQEVKTVFKYKDYGPCKPPTNDFVSYINQNLTVKCEKEPNPKYATEESGFDYYGVGRRKQPEWENDVPNIAEKQFLFVKCSKESIHALVFNRYKKEAADNANVKRRLMGGNSKPMSVLLLVFDSVSRYSSQRNMPRTTKFLWELMENTEFNNDFSLYEIEKSPVPASKTRANMAQILFGISLKEMTQEVTGENAFFRKNSQKLVEYQKNSIWSFFSGLGYVTMFSHNSVHNDLSKIIGSKVNTDHLFLKFWRYLWSIFYWHDTQNGQKCVGTRNAHDFSLDYTQQFFSNYPNNNKFAYVHINAAHEETGNVKTVDKDLLRFLQSFLRMIKERDENLALFLVSDHGYKFIPGTRWDFRSFFEYYTPMTYLILSKEVVKGLNADEVLKHNEAQLVSRYDLNLSLKHLAYFPYNITLDKWYPAAKDHYTYKNTVSLFQEKIDVNRTCIDVGVDIFSCLCAWFEEVEDSENERIIKDEALKLFAEYLSAVQGVKCELMKRIEKVKVFSFPLTSFKEGLDTLYKVEMETKMKKKVEIEFNLCLEIKSNRTDEALVGKKYPFSIFDGERARFFMQLSQVRLPDACDRDFCSC